MSGCLRDERDGAWRGAGEGGGGKILLATKFHSSLIIMQERKTLSAIQCNVTDLLARLPAPGQVTGRARGSRTEPTWEPNLTQVSQLATSQPGAPITVLLQMSTAVGSEEGGRRR